MASKNTCMLNTLLILFTAPAVPEFFAEGRGNNISVMWKRQDGASGYTLYWCTGHLHCDKKVTNYCSQHLFLAKSQ